MENEQSGYRCAVLTISTGCAAGTREDLSGPEAARLLERAGFAVVARAIVPDTVEAIAAALTGWADLDQIPLIVTSGGTGLTPNDVTPEATLSVLQRIVPGIPEAMRMRTLSATPMAMISRGVAGTRGKSLIINLPGSPKGVRECLEVALPVLQHGIALLREDRTTH